MKKVQNIIVPIDFLEHTEPLVEYALYIGKQFGASLKFTHIIEEPSYNLGPYESPSLETFLAKTVGHAKEKMEQFVKKNQEIYPDCEGEVLQGNVVDSIIKLVHASGADLIILGTHGRKGLERMWLGSVAERVIKSAPCPTLTCNPYKETK